MKPFIDVELSLLQRRAYMNWLLMMLFWLRINSWQSKLKPWQTNLTLFHNNCMLFNQLNLLIHKLEDEPCVEELMKYGCVWPKKKLIKSLTIWQAKTKKATTKEENKFIIMGATKATIRLETYLKTRVKAVSFIQETILTRIKEVHPIDLLTKVQAFMREPPSLRIFWHNLCKSPFLTTKHKIDN